MTYRRRLLRSLFVSEDDKAKGSSSRRGKGGPDSYNLYDRTPDFKNNYGWSVALEEHDYSFLEHSGVSVFLVNLTAGSMMAPHVNPTATEYGVVLGGSGTLQIVYPNGTSAVNTQIKEGDVFVVPRYFPFCQIASRTGPLEFFGFTTSSRRNWPQFLVGASSVLQTLRGPELAAAFGVSLERFDSIAGAQREAVILPTAEVAPGDVESSKEETE
uniref:Cupin type-1 domain-containing protein n=1 Tax=Kalanchoe fedtschenkoi TaxID=63787 RepID=A0A7N0TAM5_KALFE